MFYSEFYFKYLVCIKAGTSHRPYNKSDDVGAYPCGRPAVFAITKQKGKTLSLTHQPNKIIVFLIEVARTAVEEVDTPRIATKVSIGRRRPIPTRHRIWKIR